MGAAVDDAGTHTAAGALAAGYEGVDSQIIQVPYQGRAPEGAGRGLAQDRFARQRSDLVDDVPAVLAAVGCFGTRFGRALRLTPGAPALDATVLQAGHVD